MTDDLCQLTAREAVDLLRTGKVSPLEMVDAAATRIEATDGRLNALPTLCIERARERAEQIGAGRDGEDNTPGWLGGLPIAVKDLNDVAGVRTTYGSPLFAEHVPERSDVMVETLEAKGAIVIGKSNTPEFGHGANTFNEVFGETVNPWNTEMTCGGSSGGSAVAVASGQTWLATGSDLGCSLRTPAAFCSIVGLRPSPGRVARAPTRLPYDNLWVQGPMARNVGDTALMLDAMCGEHPQDPISLAAPAHPFVDAVDNPKAPLRIAYSPDLGGIVPVAGEVADICAAAAARLSDLGATVEEACPDFSDVRDIFHILRANQFVGDLGEIILANKDQVREEVVWNLERGIGLSAGDLAEAERKRGALYARAAAFFETYDLLVTPATIVAPFDVKVRAINEVEGHTFENYFDWYTIAYAITATSLPAMSLPCGFTDAGLPVGLQVVGPPRGEASLLGAARLIEDLFAIAGQLPIDPRAAIG
ncbi:MAG: amidase [Rhodospirillaceae bacterium]|nr:amidase [Rhodospirillaceae bacterium]